MQTASLIDETKIFRIPIEENFDDPFTRDYILDFDEAQK